MYKVSTQKHTAFLYINKELENRIFKKDVNRDIVFRNTNTQKISVLPKLSSRFSATSSASHGNITYIH